MLQVRQQSSHIIACGDGVQVFDAGSAQLLNDLTAVQALCGDSGAAKAFRSVAYSGNVLAAGLAGGVVVWDPRTPDPVAVVSPPAAASTAGVSSFQTAWLRDPTCVAVQLDDWKLVAAFNDRAAAQPERNAQQQQQQLLPACAVAGPSEAPAGLYQALVAVFDMRAVPAASGATGAPWSRPLLALPSADPINCLRFHEGLILTGHSGRDCSLRSFEAPAQSVAGVVAVRGGSIEAPVPQQGGSLPPSGGGAAEGETVFGQADSDPRRRRAAKPAKPLKKLPNNNRFARRR